MRLTLQWFGLVALAGGCGNWPPPLIVDRDMVVTGNLDVQGELTAASGEIGGGEIADGNIAVPGEVTIGDDLNVGGNITNITPPITPPVTLPPVMPPPVTLPSPLPLSAELIAPVNGAVLNSGQKFDVVLEVSGGVPPYTITCLIPGGALLKKEFAAAPAQFTGVSISSPTNEAMFCQVEDRAGEKTSFLSAWLTVE